MKLGQIADSKFQGALNRLISQEMPIKTAFKLKGVVIAANDALRKYRELKNELIIKHGKLKSNGKPDLDKNGNPQFTEDGLKKFLQSMKELERIEVALEAVSVSDLFEGHEISIDDLIVLDGLITED